MKERYLFIVLAAAAAAVLAGCQKESPRDRNLKGVRSTVFTATVEDVVETRTTFNPTDLRISWEKGDRVNINGSSFISQNAGASTTLDGSPTIEVRPQFVSSPSGGFQDQEPSMLVDNKGTETKWCTHNNHKGGAAWTIIVSTDASYKLQAIKLWNGGDTHQYPGRRWKNVTVSGSASASGTWEEIKSFRNLELAASDGGFAGTLDVNATAPYQYYKIEISDIVDGDTMQMSDMTFLILDEKGTISSPYTAYFPETLYNNNKPTLPSIISETWTEGGFNMPMYAQSTTKDLQFKNLCGVLKVIVKNDQLARVRDITVGSSNCATSGAFTVKDNKAVLTSPSATANTLTINYTEAVQTTPEGTAFYIPIPAQTYRDLEISMTSNEGIRKMTINSGEDFVVERNRIYTIDFAAPARAYVELAGIKWATEDVGKVDGVDAILTDETYGYYYKYNWPGGDALQAAESWGGKWTLPTEDQWFKIAEECDWTWKEDYSFNGKKMNGFIVSDKNDPSKFIFLPGAGIWAYDFSTGIGVAIDYWTKESLYFFAYFEGGDGGRFRWGSDVWYGDVGALVRPILSE